MPIRPETRFLYPIDWAQISERVRFKRAKGRCERCGRPHGQRVAQLQDGRWFDLAAGVWRDDAGERVGNPDLVELAGKREKQIRLATCHRNHEPWAADDESLAAWCGRCHLRYDREEHRRQRRLNWLRRRARGDLFTGPYPLI